MLSLSENQCFINKALRWRRQFWLAGVNFIPAKQSLWLMKPLTTFHLIHFLTFFYRQLFYRNHCSSDSLWTLIFTWWAHSLLYQPLTCHNSFINNSFISSIPYLFWKSFRWKWYRMYQTKMLQENTNYLFFFGYYSMKNCHTIDGKSCF